MTSKVSIRGRLAIAGVVVGLIAVGFLIFLSRSQWVPAGHVGVIYSAARGLQPEVIPPKRVFIPWMSTLYVYPTMVKSAIYTNDPEEGEIKAADAIQITTNDNASTPFDVVVWYRVKPEDVHTLFNNFRAIPIEEIQSQHIRRAVKEAVNLAGTRYDAFQLMGPKRGEASGYLLKQLQGTLGRKGITVERAEFAGAYPNEQITQRIMSRVNSMTELEISRIRQQIAQVQRDTAVVKAKAQNEAQKLTAATTKGKSLELLSLEADIEGLKKWDGQMPAIQTKPGQTVIVTPDLLSQMRGGGQ